MSESMFDALRQIGLYADVMIGNGPGAVDAYYRHPDRVAEGLPTQFGQMRDHAKEIRRIVQATLAPDTDLIDGPCRDRGRPSEVIGRVGHSENLARGE